MTGAMHDCTRLSKHINDAHFDAVDNAQAMHKNTPVHQHLLYCLVEMIIQAVHEE